MRQRVVGQFPISAASTERAHFPGHKSALVASELGICAHRPNHLVGRVYYNVRPIYDYVMAASGRDYLLAVLRKRQQFSLKLDIVGAAILIRADINERLVAKRVQLFFDRCEFRETLLAYSNSRLGSRVFPRFGPFM